MSYVSSSEIALFLNATLNESDEAYLDGLIPPIEAAGEVACNRAWDVTTPQSQTFNGGMMQLFPRSTPISSVFALAVNTVDMSCPIANRTRIRKWEHSPCTELTLHTI
jgi:hypothetical protein